MSTFSDLNRRRSADDSSSESDEEYEDNASFIFFQYMRRWGTLQREITLFNGLHKQAEDSSNGDDPNGVLMKARALYKANRKKVFTYEAVWRKAKNHPKWNVNVIRQARDAKLSAPPQSPSVVSSASSAGEEEPERPKGKKASKRVKQTEEAEQKYQHVLGDFVQTEKEKLEFTRQRLLEKRRVRMDYRITEILNQLNESRLRLDSFYAMNTQNMEAERKEYYTEQKKQLREEIERLQKEKATLEEERQKIEQ